MGRIYTLLRDYGVEGSHCVLYKSCPYTKADLPALQFSFTGPKTHDGRFPIYVSSLDLDSIRDSADCIIAQKPDEHEIAFGDPCNEELGCSQQCQTLQDALGRKCIMLQIKDATERKQDLASLHLLREYVRNPWNANGMQTLAGRAQDTCIYETQ